MKNSDEWSDSFPAPLEIISASGDSTLESFTFSGGILTVYFRHGESDKRMLLKIDTDVLYSNHRIGSYNNTFYISTVDLKSCLSEKNGVFVPSSDFAGFMRESRDLLNLAYGMRVSQFGLQVSLIGDFRLSTIVKGMDNISFSYI